MMNDHLGDTMAFGFLMCVHADIMLMVLLFEHGV